jgi:hypothetical protein
MVFREGCEVDFSAVVDERLRIEGFSWPASSRFVALSTGLHWGSLIWFIKYRIAHT